MTTTTTLHKPLNLTSKVKEKIHELAKRAINNASIYNRLVLVNNDIIVYPLDNINQVMVALKISMLEARIKELTHA